MDTLIDIISRGFDTDNRDMLPKLAVGIACFGAALVLGALAPDHDETLRRKDAERREFNARPRPA